VVEKGEQSVEVAVDVQQAARLGVQAQLRPRQDLEELLESASAAGQGDERISQISGPGSGTGSGEDGNALH
jgi:hypothetical protein